MPAIKKLNLLYRIKQTGYTSARKNLKKKPASAGF